MNSFCKRLPDSNDLYRSNAPVQGQEGNWYKCVWSMCTIPVLPYLWPWLTVILWRQNDMLCTSSFANNVIFYIMESIGQNQRRCFVEFARWHHWGDIAVHVCMLATFCNYRTQEVL